MTKQTKFTAQMRGNLPNRICQHFDKYCEIINPITFDPLRDIYRPSLSRAEWEALQVLLESKHKSTYLNVSYAFDVYVNNDSNLRHHQRTHVTFPFPEQSMLPGLDLELSALPSGIRDEVHAWARKAVGLQKLRSKLWKRMENVMDIGWDSHKTYDSYRGCWRGGATSGQGVNTPGQLARLWPEVMAFLPVDYRDIVRGAQVKSRLPKFIYNWGTPEQFLLKERPYHINNYDPDNDEVLDQRQPFTDEEWEIEKRTLEGINHILTQMSLMKDVPRVKGYPSICNA